MDHWYGFRSNMLSADNILCIGQILKQNGTHRISASNVCRLKKAYDSVNRDVLYNILIELFFIAMKPASVTKCV